MQGWLENRMVAKTHASRSKGWGCLCLALIFASPNWSAISIQWDATTRKFACAGVYGRAKKLSNGELALVYSRGADVWIRKSTDAGTTWGAEVLVARDNGYNNTNAEMLELANGWLVYGWNGRPQGVNPYFIGTTISRDRGRTWSDKIRAYSAGSDFGTGCWEPAFLQLPSGELHVYFANEGPYPNNNDQEIALMRSQDNGISWGEYTVVSHRTGARDGMPVPVYLGATKGIAVAIEDNGIQGLFKPVIVSSPAGENWSAGAVTGSDSRRWQALSPSSRLPDNVYAGAPYLVRVPSGETALSVQSTEGRTGTGDPAQYSIMQVYTGDADAKNFSQKTTPFPNIPTTGNSLWNSLAVLNDSTIMAVSSVNGLGQNGLWTVMGKVRAVGPVKIVFKLGPDENLRYPVMGLNIKGRTVLMRNRMTLRRIR